MIPGIPALTLRSSVMAAVLFISALAVHGGGWYLISKHLGLSSALFSGLVALAVMKHLGWIGVIYAFFRRRSKL